MRKWEKLGKYLSEKKVPRGATITIQLSELNSIVGKLPQKFPKRISYWDPYMGRKNPTPGSVASKAGFVLSAIDWDFPNGEPTMSRISLYRYL